MFQILVAVLLMAAPATAQDFRSTSTLQGSGSQYTPQVAPVGSVQPMPVQSTAGSLPSPISGRRRVDDDEVSGDFDSPEEANKSDQSPVGEPWALLGFAAAACGIVFLHRRKAQADNNA